MKKDSQKTSGHKNLQIVADTSALIYPAKNPEFIRILKKIFKTIYIPPAVHQESIERGKELGKQDALLLEKLVEEGFLIIKPLDAAGVKIKEKLSRNRALGRGEIEVISLAKQMSFDRVLIDDKLASEAARALELKAVPITYVLILSIGREIISYTEGLKILHQIISEGYRLSAEDYIAIKNKMERADL